MNQRKRQQKNPHAELCAWANGLRPDSLRPTIEFVYTWPDGREEIRYTRIDGTEAANLMIAEVEELQRKHGESCRYSYRTRVNRANSKRTGK